MDAIVYEYCPPSSQLFAAGNTNVVSRCSSVWWTITPEAADLPYAAGERRAAGASDDDDDRSGWMSGGPRAYRATMDFLLKPAERVLIVFTGVDADGDRPDALYDVRSGPELRLERSHFLASFVENCSRETNVFVHRGSRLNHLLQLTFIDSCLTLLPGKNQRDTVHAAAAAAAARAAVHVEPIHRDDEDAADEDEDENEDEDEDDDDDIEIINREP